MVEKLTFKCLTTALVDILAVNMPIAQTLNLRHLWRCVTQLHILQWPFIVPSTRFPCVMIMLFNQLVDMPHVRWMDYLDNGEMLTNRDGNKFVPNILEKFAFCVLWNIERTLLVFIFLFSAV
jgi:hypothetical protein